MILRPAVLAPMVLSLAFLLLITAQLTGLVWDAPEAQKQDPPAGEAILPLGDAMPAMRGDAADVILARPLFSPQRRGQQMAGVAVGDGSIPRLAGIVVAGRTRQAVFQRPGEKPLSLGVGEALGLWTIKEINAHDVVLQKPGGTMTIEPAIDPSPAVPGLGVPPAAMGVPMVRRPFAPGLAGRP